MVIPTSRSLKLSITVLHCLSSAPVRLIWRGNKTVKEARRGHGAASLLLPRPAKTLKERDYNSRRLWHSPDTRPSSAASAVIILSRARSGLSRARSGLITFEVQF